MLSIENEGMLMGENLLYQISNQAFSGVTDHQTGHGDKGIRATISTLKKVLNESKKFREYHSQDLPAVHTSTRRQYEAYLACVKRSTSLHPCSPLTHTTVAASSSCASGITHLTSCTSGQGQCIGPTTHSNVEGQR